MLTRWWWFAIGCWLCSFTGQAFHADVFVFDDKTQQKQLFPFVYYQTTPKDVTVDALVFDPERHHAFQIVTRPTQVFLSAQETVWFFARLGYRGQQSATFILDYDFPAADLVEFYSYDRQTHEIRQLNRSGSHYPFNERQVQSRSYAITLHFKPEQELDLLVRVQDKALIQSKFTLMQQDVFAHQQLLNNLLDGLLLGFLVLIALYNILLYLNIREVIYLNFAGFFASFALVIGIINGAAFALLWPNQPATNPAIFYIAVGAMLAFLSLATDNMLNHRARSRWLWLHLILAAALLFSPLYSSDEMQLPLMLTVLSGIMLTNLARVMVFSLSGQAKARTFAFSWMMFFAACLVLLLSQFGYIANDELWEYFLLASVICSMALMSYSLAHQMQQANEQVTVAHQHAINSLRQYYDIYHNAVEGMFTTTLHGQLITANPSLVQMLGYQDLAQMKQDVSQYSMAKYYANPDDRTHLVRQLQHSPTQNCELRALKADGTPFWVLMSARLAQNEQGEALIHGSVIDITAQKINHEQLAYLASHDPLTGLYNRHHFTHLTQQAWHRCQLEHFPSSVLYLDIDQFKLVNNTCNHSAGDALLKQISEHLKTVISGQGQLARLGGDEFGVLLLGKTAQQAFHLAYSVLEAVKEFRFFWQDSLFSVSISIGISELSADDLSGEQSIKKADAACFAAKEKGRNRIHQFQFDDQTLQRHQAEIHWMQRLQKALLNDSFILYMQPIQAIQTDSTLLHYELLLRLQGEDQQIIAPGNFLSSAERYGLMPQIDRWVLRHYCRWLAQHPQHLKKLGHCHINISGASLVDANFKSDVLALFKEYQVPAQHICFEITESMAILNLQNTLDFIHHFRALGCHFALDDFGSGFSSYGYLKNFPLDMIKIDGNFVRDLLTDQFDRAIVNSIHDVAAALGIQTVAEFVETEEICAELRSMGVDFVQGYAIAKPKPLTDLNEL